ncbi:MAG: YicC/YloC family endoribonuclease [Pseudomonadota bacterium]
MTAMGMTGFGRAEGSAPWGDWVWEARSVNGKGLDVRLTSPSGFDAIDFEARKLVKSRFKRGNFQVQLQIETQSDDASVQIDTRSLAKLARTGRNWRSAGVAPPQMDGLLSLRGVMRSQGRMQLRLSDKEAEALLKGLQEALEALNSARADEGAAIVVVLNRALDDMETSAKTAAEAAGTQPQLVRDRFVQRIQDLSGDDVGLTEDRIAQEAAVFAAKADVREELDRLAAHIASGRAILAGEGPMGRKLDFLSQELNREANTLCSKSASLELTQAGLALKAAVDQFREQVQNVE